MDFPYANGVVKAIESDLFDRAKYAKLSKTDRADFSTALSALGYGSGETGLEALIQAELTGLKAKIDEITPDRRATDVFFLPDDAVNLKILWKEKLFDAQRPERFSPLGALPAESWMKAVIDGDLSEIPSWLLPMWNDLNETLSGLETARAVSAAVDAAVFRFALRSLKGFSRIALKDHFRHQADLRNVVTLVRARALRWEWEAVEEMLLPGGSVEGETFREAWNQAAWDPFIRFFRDLYGERVARALKRYAENKDLDAFEFAMDQLLLDLSGEFRHDPFGIGPILHYCLKKMAEAKNIRQLYAEGSAGLAKLLE